MSEMFSIKGQKFSYTIGYDATNLHYVVTTLENEASIDTLFVETLKEAFLEVADRENGREQNAE